MPTVIEISPALLAIFMALFGALLTFLATLFWNARKEAREEAKENAAKVTKLVGEMALLQAQFSPFWAAVQDKISRDLTHPEAKFAEMDALLGKLGRLELTDPAEIERLEWLLLQRTTTQDEDVPQAERDSAGLMITVMRKTLVEAQWIADGNLQGTAMVSRQHAPSR